MFPELLAMLYNVFQFDEMLFFNILHQLSRFIYAVLSAVIKFIQFNQDG